MYLLGAGCAFPSIDLSNNALGAIGTIFTQAEQCLLERIGVSSRSISLPIEFIQRAKGSDVVEARKAAVVSPTTLGVEAATKALAQAGISIEQVGLVIADCATPHQTCPSEAQRIAGAFGVKVPAYDVTAGSAALPTFFTLLNSWREDRTPEYVLCISTNSPSTHVRYGSNHVAASVFGDAACALVVSRKHQGPWRVVSARARGESPRKLIVGVERHVTLHEENLPTREEFATALDAVLSDERVGDDAYVVGTGPLDREFADIMISRGVASDRIASVTARRGYSLGSAAGSALVEVWNKAASGDRLVIVHCGDGLSAKVVLMRN